MMSKVSITQHRDGILTRSPIVKIMYGHNGNSVKAESFLMVRRCYIKPKEGKIFKVLHIP